MKLDQQTRIADLQRQIDELRTECTNPPTPEMVKLPDRAYSVGKYAVTFDEYDAFCEATNRKKPSDNSWGRGNRPVINVSWYDAQAYCAWLSKQTGDHYRLPSEDEFEHFCGDHQEATPETAVYNANQTSPVGSKAPNNYGLHDVLGNVCEWQENSYE